MPLDDSQLIDITFACCGEKFVHKFVDLKAGPFGFVCPNPACGTRVNYDRYEFVRLLNEEASNVPHKITLRPLED